MKQQISYKMDGGLNAQVLKKENKTYDQFIMEDIQENVVFQKQTLKEHYNYVVTSLGPNYYGYNKFLYVKVLEAIRTILAYKRDHKRQGSELKTAITFLHQDIKLAPKTIQNILKLFEVEIGISQILEISSATFAEKPIPSWLQSVYGGVN
jgi:hypothetical protein